MYTSQPTSINNYSGPSDFEGKHKFITNKIIKSWQHTPCSGSILLQFKYHAIAVHVVLLKNTCTFSPQFQFSADNLLFRVRTDHMTMDLPF